MAQADLGQKSRSVSTLTAPEIAFLWGTGLLWFFLARIILRRAGFFDWFYGVTLVSDIPDLASSMYSLSLSGQGLWVQFLVWQSLQIHLYLALFRQGLWVTLFALPLQLGTALAYLRFGLQVSLSDIGLTTRHLARHIVVGHFFAAIFVPGAYAVQALTNLLLKHLGSAPQEHPFSMLGQLSLYPIEWALLIFGAVVAAPLWEELIYRGLVQRWILARPRWGGIAALALAMVMAIDAVYDKNLAAFSQRELVLKLAPVWILALLMGVFLVLDRFDPAWGGLFASAVLFAWVHVRVWPSPIPLLWLAIGLGWLAWRGKSLVGPIVLHALFNAFACAMLLGS